MLLRVDKATTSKFSLRTRPTSEKLVDIGFKNIVIAMASMVAVVLFSYLQLFTMNQLNRFQDMD